MEQARDKQYVFLIYLLLALATFIAFERVRQNDFISRYDDNEYVLQNPNVKAGITRDSVVWAFTTSRANNWHPLTWLSHMLDCQLFGLSPYWHHLTNLLFHIASTLLLFGVLKKMTGAVWRSAFVAAAFGLHPLHVESVAWVAERKDVLSGFFWMLTIWAYLRYAERPAIGRYLPIFLFLSLGLMAKSMLVTLPFVLLLLDYWPLGRFQWRSKNTEKSLPQSESSPLNCHKASVTYLIVEKVPLFVLAAVLSVVIFAVQQPAGALELMEILPLKVRLANALVSYLGYIVKMVYPARLAVFYPYQGQLHITNPLLLLAGISFLVILLARLRPWLTVGWLWYLGTLVPVIGLVQVGHQAMADRYTYLPSIGIFIMFAWGVSELLTRWRLRKIELRISAGLLLVVLLVCTRTQVRHWQNDFTLSEYAISVTENNYIMHNIYGCALGEKGRHEEALVHFREALRINPRLLEARRNEGVALSMQGRFDEAIAYFNEALRDNPDWCEVYSDLGMVYDIKGEYELAAQNYKKALLLNPDYLPALKNLAALKERSEIKAE